MRSLTVHNGDPFLEVQIYQEGTKVRNLTPASSMQQQFPLAMRQQMGSLAPHVARPSPQAQVHLGDTDGRSFGSGHGHGQLRTSRPRLGRVRTIDAAPKSRLLQDAAITVCKNGGLLDQDIQAVSESNRQLHTVRAEDKYFEVEMTVRDDDLDEYGVVNNAVYASYIHRGRDVLLEKLGINVDYWASTGNAMALSELNLKYYAPLKSGDRFVVKIRPVQIKGVRMVMHHLIETLPDHKLVLDARGTIVFLNKDYRPTRVFPEVAAKAWEMFACRKF